MSSVTYKNASSVKEKLDRLCSLGILSHDQIMIVLTEYKNTLNPVEKIILYLGFATENTLTSVIAEDSGIEKINLKNSILDSKLIQKLPRSIAEKFSVLPISESEGVLKLCMSDSNDIKAKDEVKKYFKSTKIQIILSSHSEIMEAIGKYYEFHMSPELILKELEKENYVHENNSFTSPVVRFVDAIVLDALKKGSSDIHFEPEKFFVRVRYRIDGLLKQLCVFHKNYWNQVCVRIKIISGIDIADAIRPHNGRFSMNLLGRNVDFRVSSHPMCHGENIVIRILDKKNFLIPLEELGYSKQNIQILKHVLQKKDGIVILTGPTGSGKTTSLYSMLSTIQSETVNIMTLEDPIEYELPLIRQSNVQNIEGRKFSDGLKSILRQDPDIILVGEIRDQTTAEMAIRAAMTGHQVFTTLHTQDAFGAIFRLIDLGISPFLLAGSISAVIAQRLIRKLCDKCKIKKEPNLHESELLKVRNLKTQKKSILYAAEEENEYQSTCYIFQESGCSECDYSGYSGRTTVTEILQFNDSINEAIYEKKSLINLMEIAKNNGFISIRQNARDLILKGQTTISEVSRVIDLLKD